MELPKIHTQEDQDKQDVESWKTGNERAQLLLLLRAFSGGGGNLPLTDDYGRVQVDATEDFRRRDYSEAQRYVDTLANLVEFYKELAENYLQVLTDYGIRTDQCGYSDGYPFAIMSHGYQVFGAIEVFDLEEQTETPEARASLWEDYIKPHLAIAKHWEKDWIVQNFPDEVAALEEGEK